MPGIIHTVYIFIMTESLFLTDSVSPIVPGIIHTVYIFIMTESLFLTDSISPIGARHNSYCLHFHCDRELVSLWFLTDSVSPVGCQA